MSVRRRSSAHVTLVLAGAAALVGCNRSSEGTPKRYASKAECVADWGTEEDCKEDTSSGHRHGGSAWLYYGAGAALGRGNLLGGGRVGAGSMGVQAPSSDNAGHPVSRGGFGATGRSGVSS
jgi:uncharacterized protein YgiB involved in biofilm formation